MSKSKKSKKILASCSLPANDPYFLDIGKFKKKSVYEAPVDMGDKLKEEFLTIGKAVITEDQYINIGFNDCLLKGINTMLKSSKNKKKLKQK